MIRRHPQHRHPQHRHPRSNPNTHPDYPKWYGNESDERDKQYEAIMEEARDAAEEALSHIGTQFEGNLAWGWLTIPRRWTRRSNEMTDGLNSLIRSRYAGMTDWWDHPLAPVDMEKGLLVPLDVEMLWHRSGAWVPGYTLAYQHYDAALNAAAEVLRSHGIPCDVTIVRE